MLIVTNYSPPQDSKEVLGKKREEEEKKKRKQLQSMSSNISGTSTPSHSRSRPLSPNPALTNPSSPLPPEMILDLLPSLEALEQQDHDILMNDLFATTPGKGY